MYVYVTWPLYPVTWPSSHCTCLIVRGCCREGWPNGSGGHSQTRLLLNADNLQKSVNHLHSGQQGYCSHYRAGGPHHCGASCTEDRKEGNFTLYTCMYTHFACIMHCTCMYVHIQFPHIQFPHIHVHKYIHTPYSLSHSHTCTYMYIHVHSHTTPIIHAHVCVHTLA